MLAFSRSTRTGPGASPVGCAERAVLAMRVLTARHPRAGRGPPRRGRPTRDPRRAHRAGAIRVEAYEKPPTTCSLPVPGRDRGPGATAHPEGDRRTPVASEQPDPQDASGPDDPGPTARRIIVGAQLRRLREAADITRSAAGYHIRGSESKISRMESGKVGFKQRDVEDLLTFYGEHDPARR